MISVIYYSCKNFIIREKNLFMKDFIIENGILLKYTGTENDVVIPDGVTSIGKAAFFQCSCLKNVTIGRNVKNIGDDAFQA